MKTIEIRVGQNTAIGGDRGAKTTLFGWNMNGFHGETFRILDHSEPTSFYDPDWVPDFKIEITHPGIMWGSGQEIYEDFCRIARAHLESNFMRAGMN